MVSELAGSAAVSPEVSGAVAWREAPACRQFRLRKSAKPRTAKSRHRSSSSPNSFLIAFLPNGAEPEGEEFRFQPGERTGRGKLRGKSGRSETGQQARPGSHSLNAGGELMK